MHGLTSYSPREKENGKEKPTSGGRREKTRDVVGSQSDVNVEQDFPFECNKLNQTITGGYRIGANKERKQKDFS